MNAGPSSHGGSVMSAAPPVLLCDVIRVCTDHNTASIIDTVLSTLIRVSRIPSC